MLDFPKNEWDTGWVKDVLFILVVETLLDYTEVY